MTLRRLLLGLLALLVLLPILALAALFLFDWGLLKDRVAGLAGGAIGREVTLDSLEVEPGWTTRVRLGGLTVANADWAEGEHLASAESLDFSIRVWPLLGGQLDLPEVRLIRPDLDLQRNAEGAVNWELSALAEAGGEVAAPEDREEFPAIGQLVIEEGQVRHRDALRGLDLEGAINTATGDAKGSDRIELDLKGALEGKPLTLTFDGGSLTQMQETERPYPVDLVLQAGDTRIEAKGEILEPVAMAGLDITLLLEGPSLAEIFPILGIPLPDTPPYRLAGDLNKDGEVWRFTGFEGRVGDSDLSGDLSLDESGEVPFLEAELTSDRLDFDDLAGLIGAAPDTAESANAEQQQEAAAEEASESIFPDTPIDRARFQAMNMDVKLTAGQVVTEQLPIDSLEARFRLQDGRLEVNPLSLGVAGGRVSGEVAVNAREAPPSADADLAFEELDLQPFFRDTAFAQEMGGRFFGKLYLIGTGESLDRLMDEAQGEGWLGMREGSVSGLLVEGAGLDLVEALALVVEDARVPIRCGRFDLQSDKGLVTVQRAIVDTTDSILLARGRVNLDSEEMDLQIEARAKDFSLIDAAAPVAVEGPFKDPSISIGGLDPLPFLEMGDAEDLDCAKLLAGEISAREVEETEGKGPE